MVGDGRGHEVLRQRSGPDRHRTQLLQRRTGEGGARQRDPADAEGPGRGGQGGATPRSARPTDSTGRARRLGPRRSGRPEPDAGTGREFGYPPAATRIRSVATPSRNPASRPHRVTSQDSRRPTGSSSPSTYRMAPAARARQPTKTN